MWLSFIIMSCVNERRWLAGQGNQPPTGAGRGRLAGCRRLLGRVVLLLAGLMLLGGGVLRAQTLQHRYSFSGNAVDAVGGANGTLNGNAAITNGALVLPGGGNAANPLGYVTLPDGIVSNNASITVECWLTDVAGLVWAEAWCFGDSAAGPGQPPSYGTAYLSLIPHSGYGDFRAAFNLTGGDEIDVVSSAGPMPLNVEEYAVVTYDAASTTARLYLNGAQVATASIPTNLAPANYGVTFNNWLGRDEFGGDPMFAGSLDELRIWSAATSPLYITASAAAGPNTVVTNLQPLAVNVGVGSSNLLAGQSLVAVVSANFLQVSNVAVTGFATNWQSSNPGVLAVDGKGLLTAVGSGAATVSATLNGVTGTSGVITVSVTNRAAGITVAYWQFNNATNLGLDSSRLGNTLTTATGAPVYSSAGKFGGTLYLDGASTLTTLGGTFPAGVPVGASPYTIAVWEKADTGNPVNGGFVSWGTAVAGNCNALRLSNAYNNPDSADNYWWANDFFIDNLAVNPGDGNWHAVVATWDGTNQILYVDGVNVGSRIPTPPSVQGVAFLVGQTVGDNNQFKGWLEDLLIANAALTPAEVGIYQAGSWLSTAPPVAQAPTASPSNAVFSGMTLTLVVTATGAAPFQYQWQKNGTNIFLATAATLGLTNVQAADAGNYDVVLVNPYGTNTSPVLAVRVTPVTNAIPLAVNILVTNTTMQAGQTQQATVTANLVQVANYPATSSATNWISSNPGVLSVNSSGLITALGAGSATVSATVNGITGTSANLTVSPLPAPTAYYPLDADVLDHSGNSNDGGNTGVTFAAPAYVSTAAAVFNGSSYVTIPKSIGLNGTGFTIAMWVKTTDTGGGPNWYSGEGLVDGEVGGMTTDFGTALVGGNFALGVGQPDTTVTSTNAINDGNWHHVAGTWNLLSGAMNVYVDGVLSARGTGPTGARAAPPSLRIGSIQTGVGGGFLNGTIDEVKLYNTEFTAQQVVAVKNSYAAAPQPGMPVASPTNSVYGGTVVTLTVPVVGLPPLQYQWQKNGTNLPGATSATLVLSNILAADAANYDVLVGNAAGTNASAGLRLTVNPPSAPFFTRQPGPGMVTNYVGSLVTLAGAVSGTQPIACQWQHNGTNIFNATASSLALASLPPGAAGTYTLVASNQYGFTNSAAVVLTVLPAPNPAALNVLTYHNDNTRRGAYTNEVLLTPANVNATTFGRLITYPTDGLIIAQPLYLAGLAIPGQGTHNVVFVATENDSVYAFDADSNAGTNGGVLWHANLGIAVSSFNNEFGNRYQGNYYGDITPVVGITGTPVIDPVSGTLYVNVHTREVGATTNYYHRIHALNVTNGNEQPYSPVAVTNSVPGTGRDSTNGIVVFNPVTENQRPGLTLAGGMLYVGYGSYADTDPYHGWVIGFNATNLQTSARNVMCTTPNATIAAFGPNAAEGALWMGGNGLCADASNNLYFITANGSFTANTGGGDYGDSFVKLATTNGLAVADYFTPYNQADLSANDTDLGSGGDLLLPDSAGSAAHPHLIVGCGKDGILRLVDRDQMGHFNAANDNQIVQEVPGAITGAWSTPAFFNQHIYYQGSGDVMKAFLITNGVIVPTPTSQATVNFGALGGTPSISANGTNNGIVWTIQSDAAGSGGPAVLHAYNATNLAVELYNSNQNPARDKAGAAITMTTPTVANGKVFVGGEYALTIYGNSLFLATPVISPPGGQFTNSQWVTLSDSTPNATLYYTLDGTVPTTNSFIYTGPILLQHNTSLSVIAGEPGAASSGVASASFVNSSAMGTGTGLTGRYWAKTSSAVFTNLNFNGLPTLTRTDATINFNWGTTGPAPLVGATNFCVRWTGTCQPQYSELYTFATTADDGVRLYVNGQLIIDNWVDKAGATTVSNSVPLAAQEYYNVELDYYQRTNNASVALAWSSPSTPWAIIPQTQLYPQTNPPPAVVLTAPAGSATRFTAPASVTITASADDQYNPVSQVAFYAGNTYLGSVSNTPYTLTTTGLPAGGYSLTAVATDGSGLSATSAPVAIVVVAGTGQPYGLTSRAAVPAFLNMPTTSSGPLPSLLSGTGAFSDTPNRVPGNGLIAYVPNSPLWSDGALKSRYFAVPNQRGGITPGQQIGFCPTNSWSFPAGSVFVKNFDLVVNETNASVPPRRLETRLLVRDINGQVYGVTYKWRSDGSDADLLASRLTENILITNATGIRTQAWTYPSPADCLACHTAQANYVLGLNTRQLNGSQTYLATGVTDNQLRTLNQLGLFNPAFDEAGITHFEKLSALTNLNVSLQERVRSYLDANCAECHLPGGSGITFDARYETPLASAKITNYAAAFNLGFDNACIIKPGDIWRSMNYQRMNTTNGTYKMPPLARNLIDTNAVQVLSDWINSLPGTPALPPPTLLPPGGSFVGQAGVVVLPASTNGVVYFTLDGSLPTTNSVLYTGPFTLLTSATVLASAYGTGYVNSVSAKGVFLIEPLRFTTQGFAKNGFQLGFAGVPGSNYVLQASTNLATWTAISTNQAQTNYFNWLDPQATNYLQRYYRVLRQP